MESYNRRAFNDAVGYQVDFVQDNQSRSVRGVLRGLHYQLQPHAQGKLVRVTLGRVFDVAVDIRRSSPHLGKWVGVELNAENRRQLWIPPGFAHGFLVLSENAEFHYKTTMYHAPSAERSLRWDDPQLAIKWPVMDIDVLLSTKDRIAPTIDDAELPSVPKPRN
jgi:dTDP-4-dehydrorhamnose 3,5-epimerase